MHVQSTSTQANKRRLILPALCCLVCTPVMPLQAQEADGEQAADPTVVVMRTVHPRIAYRGVPREDNPVQAQATTFPGRVFQGAMDTVIGSLVGDSELDRYGAAGPATGAMLPMLERGTAPLGSAVTGAVGGAPLGAAASTGGAIGGATRNLGPLVGGALAPMVDPGRQGGGP